MQTLVLELPLKRSSPRNFFVQSYSYYNYFDRMSNRKKGKLQPASNPGWKRPDLISISEAIQILTAIRGDSPLGLIQIACYKYLKIFEYNLPI
jgi:hypothetical protein